jgi:hypothetical protein
LLGPLHKIVNRRLIDQGQATFDEVAGDWSRMRKHVFPEEIRKQVLKTASLKTGKSRLTSG